MFCFRPFFGRAGTGEALFGGVRGIRHPRPEVLRAIQYLQGAALGAEALRLGAQEYPCGELLWLWRLVQNGSRGVLR